ncbi:glycoside hydrolase family 92 protein [Sphaerobolus stellatus SS14]|uniref:Glycoside hydrolase family 92 protein n=1 Tax=Sphaerobolus stellatus (strain SS14) TaxID=990650 RepID=A0A0C9W1E6_SPHS4|nr:glycoside hydrolase family 92 protein [Sphaerobolus stellatus SS14]
MRWAQYVAVVLGAIGLENPLNGSSDSYPLGTPKSDAVDHVNPMIGNGGDSPNGSGGMIPSTAPPFAMTRWVAQTRQNFVSVTPYNLTDTKIHGFQGTHQPAIWMGESGQVVVAPGVGKVTPSFEERGIPFSHNDEVATASYYSVKMRPETGGVIHGEHASTSRVGHLRFTFTDVSSPHVVLQVTRNSIVSNNESRIQVNIGDVAILPDRQEITGRNPERQDDILGPFKAERFAGYFVARFSEPFESWGTATNDTLHEGETSRTDEQVMGYARFRQNTTTVDVRVGVSFISIEQARKNLDNEIPDGTSLEKTAYQTRQTWAEKLDRVQIEGATDDQKTIFYTGFYHTLQYPYEQDEDGQYYSGYDDKVHNGTSYTGYSIWDTFRAEWAWEILFVPERIPGMVTSMLQDYQEGGWLPMWKNIVETNIMVGTHVDSLIAEAMIKGVTGFDRELAYEAVYKDATVPPVNDTTTQYADREEGTGVEARAGLTLYAVTGYVGSDTHTEAGSRTLDYAFDDYAVAVVARETGHDDVADFLFDRSKSYQKIFNNDTGFMEARFSNGSWAGEDAGWTEGDKWAYTFDVIHDVDGLIALKGGKEPFVEFLDEHFNGGHNDQTNEPSHHIPYLYAMAGVPSKGQTLIRSIAFTDYNATVDGLAGNEDCGQMSAWYLFSALGFYPVNPSSLNYVVGSPFFENVTINLPGVSKPLVIRAPGASTKPYVKSLTVNGKPISEPILTHDQIANGGEIVFSMSDVPEEWGSFSPVAHEEL